MSRFKGVSALDWFGILVCAGVAVEKAVVGQWIWTLIFAVVLVLWLRTLLLGYR